MKPPYSYTCWFNCQGFHDVCKYIGLVYIARDSKHQNWCSCENKNWTWHSILFVIFNAFLFIYIFL